MSTQAKNNNLNYLIDPTFTNINGLFVLSNEIEAHITCFSKYYVPTVEIKDFNVLKIPAKIKKKHMNKLLK